MAMRTLMTAVLGVLVLALLTCGTIPNLSDPTYGAEYSTSSPSFTPSALQLSPDHASTRTGGFSAEKLLVIAMDSDIETMDPAKTSAMYGPPGMIYETLIARDLTGAYVPGLAESWELKNTRGTAYPYNATFNITLKQGVKFHDGLAFNSDAVKRIINYCSQTDSWVQYEFWCVYGCQNKTGWPDAGIWCRDDYHMTLNLTWADVALVFNLSHLYGSMMSPDALESDGLDHYGTPGYKVVGTGPFKLAEWVAGDHVTLVKNADYNWGASWYVNKGPATIDRIVYRIIADEATRFAGFESGSIDVLQQVPPNKVLGYAANPGITVVTGPGQGTYHVEFNCAKDPWSNSSLRRAFGFAINRTQILQSVWHGYGEEGVNYLPPIVPEGRLTPPQYNFSYNPVTSAILFAEAGYVDRDSDSWLERSDMSELALNLWTTNRGEEVSMSEMLKYQFEAMGIHVTLTQYDETTLRSRAAAGEQEAILFWYSWPRAEILDWHFGTWAAGGSNTGWYMDSVFDDYVTNWTYAETEQQFSDNATAGHIRLLTQGPWAPILYWHQIDAVHNRVTGWYVHPLGREQAFNILDVDVNPTAVALVTPNPATAGETVTFDGTGSSDDVGIVNWTWTFTDGGNSVALWGEIATYGFLNVLQTVDVTLTVRDGDGNMDTDTGTLEIIDFPISWAASLPSYSSTSSLSVSYVATDSGSGVNYVELYYRLGPSGSFTKYVTSGNPAGHWTTSPIVFDTTQTGGNGLYQFYTRATDMFGNVEPAPASPDASTIVDTIAPSTLHGILGTAGTNGWYVSSVTVTLVAGDTTSGAASTEYRIDPGSWLPYTSSFVFSTEGSHLLEYYSVDNAGNLESIKSAALNIDASDPISTITVTGVLGDNGWFVGASVDVNFTAVDGTSGIAAIFFRMNGGNWQSYLNEFQASQEGTTIIEYYATDIAGNSESPRPFSFRLDSGAPLLTLNLQNSTKFTSDTVVLTWSSSEGVSGMNRTEYSLDGGAFQTCVGGSLELTGLADGDHDLVLRVTDNAGNIVTKSVSFTVNTNLFSVSGPVGPWLDVGLIAIALAAVFALVFLMRRRKKAKPSQSSGD